MNMRSHVDPCTYVAFIHVQAGDLDEKFIEMLKSFRPEQGAPSEDLLMRLPKRSQQIRFHEDYHFWQGLRLPFVYRYAMISVRLAYQAFHQLVKVDKNYRTWGCILPEFSRMSIGERIGRSQQRIFLTQGGGKLPEEVEDEIELRPLDLLECATSLAEFQVSTHGDKSDPKVLSRWAKRNPAYLEPFEFASRFLENRELALRCALPLINATFHTSDPIRTYVELLARVGGTFSGSSAFASEFLSQREPCRWSEMFAAWLDTIEFDAGPDTDGHILGSPYHRITLDTWVNGAMVNADGDSVIHPFLGVPARRWIKEQELNPEYSMLMDQPAWVSNETFWKCRNAFGPTLTVYRFHLGGENDRTLLVGDADGSAFTSRSLKNAEEWRAFMADFLALYGAVRRASGAHFDADQRTCHQLHCPHYEDNFCNMYPIVPENFEFCGFPDRIQRIIDMAWS